jgi:flavin reductase (DIM6/NTAB) family NADH-FMN oxidoreductase RutF
MPKTFWILTPGSCIPTISNLRISIFIRQVTVVKKLKDPSTALFPVPAVLVTVASEDGRGNIITLAWVGTVNSEPPMLSISVRPSRHSHRLLEGAGEFVVNLPGAGMVREVDLCGMVSGKDEDKFALCGFGRQPAARVKAPLIDRCPVNIECAVRNKLSLGSHDLYLGEVLAVHVDEAVLEGGRIDLKKVNPLAYAAGEYWSLGEKLSMMGFSVRK